MNIFATSPDPHECAVALDDVRLGVQIKEVGQAVSDGLHKFHVSHPAMTKPFNPNHPTPSWIASDDEHLHWALVYGLECETEWNYRKGYGHGSGWRLNELFDWLGYDLVPKEDIEFSNVTPYDWQDVHAAYRQTLLDKWASDVAQNRPIKWTNRGAPEWASEFQED